MGLFERIAAHMYEASQPGFDLEKFNKLSQKIDCEFSEIKADLQSDAYKEHPDEFISKTWNFIHAAFFLKIFAQPNPKHSLEEALSIFEPQIKAVDESDMNHLEKKSFEEFKHIIEIARELVNSH